MAMSVIGALRVVLGMDAGEFKKGTKESESRLDRLGRKFGITARQAKIAGAAMGAAITGTAVAVGVSVNRALADFDKLTKLSRSIGVPVEEMSRLQHAAELSGASIEELGRAFRNVARNMQGAARAPTDFSRALDSLNVQWRDAEGNFRRADQLLLDVADRFATMEDGAGKTALAMKIFGEEMGPRLVSLLNSGSAGIKGMTAEAERLGLAFDRVAGEAAEHFNDQMDRISKAGAGFTTQLTVRLLPALEVLVDRFEAWVNKGGEASALVDVMSRGFTGMTEGILRVSAAMETFGLRIGQVKYNLADALTMDVDAIEERNRITAARISKIYGDLTFDLEKLWADFNSRTNGWMPTVENLGGGSGGTGKPPAVAAIEQQNAALQLLNEAERERLSIMEAMQTPYERMIEQQTRLNELFGASARDAGILAKANQMAAAAMHNAYASAASAVSGALTQLFDQSKGLAIANALINTYEAVTAALKNPPGPPFSYVYAAAALAQGLAQVQAIRSTNKTGSGGGGGAATSGGGFSSSAQAAQPAQPQQQQSLFLTMQGETFGREQVFGLINMINEATADGAKLIVRTA